jgi:hypothetical protein
VLLDPPLLSAIIVLVGAETEAPAAEPVRLLVLVPVGIVVAPVPVSTVVVPAVTRGLAVKADEVDWIPGQLVLPMTVTVEGCASPSLTAFLPVVQSQLESPGQQYQSWLLSHLASGIEVFESGEKYISRAHAACFSQIGTYFEQSTIPDTWV